MRRQGKLHLIIAAALAEAQAVTIAELCERRWPGETITRSHRVSMTRTAKAFSGLEHRKGDRGELIFFRPVETPEADLVKRWESEIEAATVPWHGSGLSATGRRDTPDSVDTAPAPEIIEVEALEITDKDTWAHIPIAHADIENVFTAYGAEHDDVEEDDEEEEDEEDVPADIGEAIEENVFGDLPIGAPAILFDSTYTDDIGDTQEFNDGDAPRMENEDTDEPFIDWRRGFRTLRTRDIKREADRKTPGDQADEEEWERKHSTGDNPQPTINDQQRFDRALQLMAAQKAARHLFKFLATSPLMGFLRVDFTIRQGWGSDVVCERLSAADVERNVFTAYGAKHSEVRDDIVTFWRINDEERDEDKRRTKPEPLLEKTWDEHYPPHVTGANADGETYLRASSVMSQVAPHEYVSSAWRRWRADERKELPAQYAVHENFDALRSDRPREAWKLKASVVFKKLDLGKRWYAHKSVNKQSDDNHAGHGISPSLWKLINDNYNKVDHSTKFAQAISIATTEWSRRSENFASYFDRAAGSDDDLYLDGNTGKWMTWAKLDKRWMEPFIYTTDKSRSPTATQWPPVWQMEPRRYYGNEGRGRNFTMEDCWEEPHTARLRYIPSPQHYTMRDHIIWLARVRLASVRLISNGLASEAPAQRRAFAGRLRRARLARARRARAAAALGCLTRRKLYAAKAAMHLRGSVARWWLHHCDHKWQARSAPKPRSQSHLRSLGFVWKCMRREREAGGYHKPSHRRVTFGSTMLMPPLVRQPILDENNVKVGSELVLRATITRAHADTLSMGEIDGFLRSRGAISGPIQRISVPPITPAFDDDLARAAKADIAARLALAMRLKPQGFAGSGADVD